jgi:predicted nucleotidyltransferase
MAKCAAMISDQVRTRYEFALRRQKQKQHELVLRHQKGSKVARQAAQLLQEKFTVPKIVLFGSLLDLRKIHLHSDIDLAVWGLSDDCYYQALAELLDLDSEFSFDLVQFEFASPPLQIAILTTGIELNDESTHAANFSSLPLSDLIMTGHATLIGQIKQNLSELEPMVKQTSRLLNKILDTGDEDYLGTIALNLHSFYTGAERIFRDIAQNIDGGLPEGADWHRRLLRQMSAEIPKIRPPAITLETRTALDEYCSFRHLVRNIYIFNLRLDRIQRLVEELPNCYELLRPDCENFCTAISEL